MDVTEHEFKPEKAKESILLVKQKMCKTHDLIKQYTDKVKEADCLKSDLEIAKKDTRHMTCDYKSIMTKTRELELNITEVKKKNCNLLKKIDEYEITIAADKKNIQQLTCKIKNMEEECSIKAMEYNLQKSSLEDKVKELEHELKTLMKSEIRKRKKRIISTDSTGKLSMETKSSVDVGVNVSLYKDGLDAKPEVQEKSIMTDEFYNTKDDPYPLFCAKCQVHLHSPPIKQICRMMSICPKLNEPISSPKRISSPSRRFLFPGTPMESLNRNEDIVPSKLSSTSCLRSPCSKYNNIANDTILQSENSSAVTQNFENIELREQTNLITHNNMITNLSSNPDLVSTIMFSPLQNKESCGKEDHYSTELIAKNTSSIKKMKGKLQSLKNKIENQLDKLRKKLNANCSGNHCTDYNNAISLNPALLANICKNMVRFCNEEQEACFKNMPNIKLGKCKHSLKKIKLKREKRLKRYKAFKNEWTVEHIDGKCSQNTFCDATGYTADTADITELERYLLCKNKNNSISNLDVSNKFFNDTNKSNNKKSLLCLAEKTTVIEDNLATLHSNMSNNFLYNNKVQPVSSNCNDEVITKSLSTCSDEDSILDYKDNKILDTVTEESRIKNRGKTDNRLLKEMNLKRKNKETDLHLNERNNIELQSNYSLEYYEPAEKRQISHTQETLVVQSNIVQKDCIDQTNAKLGFSSSLREEYGNQQLRNTQIQKYGLSNDNIKNCKTNEKYNVKSVAEHNDKQTHSIDERSIDEENLCLTETEHFVNDSNLASYSTESRCVSRSTISEFDKYDEILVEHRSNDNVSIKRIMTEMSDDSNQPNILCNIYKSNGMLSNTMEDLHFERLKPSKKYVINRSKSPCKDPQYQPTKYVQVKTIEGAEKINLPIITSECDINKVYNDKTDISKDASDKNSECLVENSLLVQNSKIVEDDNNANKFHDEIKSGTVIGNETNEISNIMQNENVYVNREAEIESIHISQNNMEKIHTPIFYLRKYINEENVTRKLPRKKITNAHKIIDKFVKQQLERLTNNDWEDSIHYDVIEKLNSICKPRIIAKCIVEFLSECSQHDYDLDRSFTPPAPIMATFQQKIIALLIDLEISKPTIVSFVQAGIEYKLFQLNSKLQISEIDALTRIYVALARIQNDRERVRIMCCDALYCMGFHAISLLFTVLTCWPDILPNSDVDKGILPKSIVFLISSIKCDGIYPKLSPLKKFIFSHYKYTQQVVIEDFVKQLLNVLKTKHYDGLDTAIILIAKREGTSWTYETIIQPTLLPMIINYEHICIYRAFSLLGKLLRTFPLKAKDNIVKEICVQLSELLQSDEGSNDQQEGITSALLSLSRHEFDIVAKSVMSWTPNESLRPNTIAQIKAFIKTRSPIFWKRYIQTKVYKKCSK